jgi:hypothetical protein
LDSVFLKNDLDFVEYNELYTFEAYLNATKVFESNSLSYSMTSRYLSKINTVKCFSKSKKVAHFGEFCLIAGSGGIELWSLSNLKYSFSTLFLGRRMLEVDKDG